MLSGGVSTFKRSNRSGTHGFTLPVARFEYNDLGHRVAKHSYHPSTYQLTQSTFYLRDPSGRLLSVYTKSPNLPAQETERYLYGMDMIGVMQMDLLNGDPIHVEPEPCETCPPPPPPPPPPLSVGMGCTGQRMYYLKDQVGNVRVILLRGTTAGTPPLAFQNYYPFGMSHPGGLTGSFTQRFGYQGEYAEQDPETRLAAFEARMFDAVTGRWLAVDPQHQCHSPYLAMGNNPVMMVDPDGEFAHIVVGALVGGTLNVIFNAGSVDNFGEALALFGAGAASGGLTAAFGPLGALAGGMITGSVNNIVAQTNKTTGLSGVNWNQVKMSGFVGGVSSIAGYGAGSLASNTLGAPLINSWKVTSPVLKGLINGSISGGAGGYAGGFAAGLLTTGDINKANSFGLKGLVSGSVMGGGMGSASAYLSAKKQGVDPWTGKATKVKFQKDNVEFLRDFARENGWERNMDSNIEEYGVNGEWRLKIKAHGSTRPGLESWSWNPRASIRMGHGLYFDPFTNQYVPMSIGGHIPLQQHYPSVQPSPVRIDWWRR